MGAAMSAAPGEPRQRAVMATDSEWERVSKAAAAAGMEKSRYVIHRTLGPESLPPEVTRRAIRQSLVLAVLEERALRDAGAGEKWDAACAAVDAWLEREGTLSRLTDPGAANRWKAVARPDMGEDDPS